MAQSLFLRMGLFLQRTKITATAVTMIMMAANTPNTAPTAAPTGDSAPLVAGGLVGVAGSIEGWLPLDVVAVLVVGGTIVVIPSYVCVVCVGRIYTL